MNSHNPPALRAKFLNFRNSLQVINTSELPIGLTTEHNLNSIVSDSYCRTINYIGYGRWKIIDNLDTMICGLLHIHMLPYSQEQIYDMQNYK
jgi:hypothetical protein